MNKLDPVVENGLLWNLEKKLDPNKVNKLVDLISEKLNYPRSRVWALLDRSKIGKRGDKEKVLTPKFNDRGYYHWAFTLYILGVSLDEMGIENDADSQKIRELIRDFEKEKRAQFFNNDEETDFHPLDDVQVYSLRGFKDKDKPSYQKQLKKDYEKALGECIKEFHKSLVVYDYLERQSGDDGGELEFYVKANDTLFQEIEKKIFSDGNKIQNYSRLLALPRRLLDKESGDSLKKKIVKYCSTPLLAHICRILDKRHEFEADGCETGGFFMLYDTPRESHYGLFDKKFIVSEYFTYSEIGTFTPDQLYINRGKIETIVNIYTSEIEKFTRNSKSTRFTRDGVLDLLDELILEEKKDLESKNKINDGEETPLEKKKRIVGLILPQ